MWVCLPVKIHSSQLCSDLQKENLKAIRLKISNWLKLFNATNYLTADVAQYWVACRNTHLLNEVKRGCPPPLTNIVCPSTNLINSFACLPKIAFIVTYIFNAQSVFCAFDLINSGLKRHEGVCGATIFASKWIHTELKGYQCHFKCESFQPTTISWYQIVILNRKPQIRDNLLTWFALFKSCKYYQCEWLIF